MIFNWHLIGHNKQTEYLQKQIISGKINHAYLFHGIANLGKKQAANDFISSVICLDDSSKPCGKCRNCKILKKKIYTDIIQIDPLKNNISIQQIRELRKSFSIKTWNKNWQIAVINEAQTITLQAANALLKILEEPASRKIIILIADDISNLPKTIISRCQLIKFNTVPKKTILNFLQSKEIDSEKQNLIAELSSGCPEIAKKFINDKKISDFAQINQKIVDLYCEKNISTKLEKFESFFKSDSQIKQFIENSIFIWRDVYLLKNSLEDLLINKSLMNKLNILARKFSYQKIDFLINNFYQLKNNSFRMNTKLFISNIIINL